MKYLFLMGPSGSGKTTLAKTLGDKPDKYKRLTQCTTREKRQNETEGVEYNFLTKGQFDKLNSENKLTTVVKREFGNTSYGTPIKDLDPKKVNIIIASIEGLLDSMNKINPEEDDIHVVFICNVSEPEAKRANRSFKEEEKYTRIVLEKLKGINLITIPHQKLINIRDCRLKLNRFLVMRGVK